MDSDLNHLHGNTISRDSGNIQTLKISVPGLKVLRTTTVFFLKVFKIVSRLGST